MLAQTHTRTHGHIYIFFKCDKAEANNIQKLWMKVLYLFAKQSKERYVYIRVLTGAKEIEHHF